MVSPQDRREGQEGVEIVLGRMTDVHAVGACRGSAIERDDSVRGLGAEPESEPRIDEAGVRRRNEREVRRQSTFDPAIRSTRIQVASDLGLGRCVSGSLDPDVRSPALAGSRPCDQVADDPSIVQRCTARRTGAVPELLDFGAEIDVSREGGLQRDLALVPLGEQRGRVRQVLFGKWPNLETAHRRRTIALG